MRNYKRAMDLIVSLPAFFALSPLLILLSVLVRLLVGSPVFFKQARPGKNGQPFILYKFRTMSDERDAQGNLLPDSKRITKLGQFLRSTSMDELPQLFNVISGNMSLVGPRPLLMRYLKRYSAEQFRRHEVKPGLTGWAQINGRNAINWEEKFKLDLWYVDHHCLMIDLKIIFKTIKNAFLREAISYQGHATMPEFDE
jgi:sugar transferase EpsL